MNIMDRRNGLPEFGYYDNQGDYDHAYGLMTNTRIPVDLTEWYFICANYDPIDVDEAGSDLNNSDINYWLNHVDEDGEYVTHSGLGNSAKVEFISRSDLLRARGFKV